MWVWFAVLACVGVVGTGWAIMLGESHFGAMRLITWGLFFHAPLLLAASAVLWWRTNRRWAVTSLLATAGLLAIAVDAFLIEPYWLEVSHVEIASPKLKRPWRIVVVADVQTDNIGQYERDVLRRVVEEKPDLVLFAGDYIQAPWPESVDVRKQLNSLLREVDLSAKAKVFAVRGNLDHARVWESGFEGLGYTVVPKTQSFQLDGLRLTCLSLENSYWAKLRLPTKPDGQFHVIVGHVPDFALGPVEGDLLLTGHTHGWPGLPAVHWGHLAPCGGAAVLACPADRYRAGADPYHLPRRGNGAGICPADPVHVPA